MVRSCPSGQSWPVGRAWFPRSMSVLTSAGTQALSGGPMSSPWRAGERLGVLRSCMTSPAVDLAALPGLIAAVACAVLLGLLLAGPFAGAAEGHPAIIQHPAIWLAIGLALPLLLGTGTLLRARQREKAL